MSLVYGQNFQVELAVVIRAKSLDFIRASLVGSPLSDACSQIHQLFPLYNQAWPLTRSSAELPRPRKIHEL